MHSFGLAVATHKFRARTEFPFERVTPLFGLGFDYNSRPLGPTPDIPPCNGLIFPCSMGARVPAEVRKRLLKCAWTFVASESESL